jgi:hypothetical protein
MTQFNHQPTDDPRWQHAHHVAEALREALTTIGLPPSELVPLTLQADGTGAPLVRVPLLRPESAERVLTGLGPSLGPQGAHLARPRPMP